eukprot:6456774-Amphidinium_carterae.2
MCYPLIQNRLLVGATWNTLSVLHLLRPVHAWRPLDGASPAHVPAPPMLWTWGSKKYQGTTACAHTDPYTQTGINLRTEAVSANWIKLGLGRVFLKSSSLKL